MTTNREDKMSDARPATPTEAPRHDELIQDLRRSRFFGCCTNGCRTDEPKCERCLFIARIIAALAASSGVSASPQEAMQQIGACYQLFQRAGMKSASPYLPTAIQQYVARESAALTDALASALKYMRHEPWCRSKWCYKCTGRENDANNYVHTQLDNAFYHVFAPRGCDCGLEDVLTILRRPQGEQT